MKKEELSAIAQRWDGVTKGYKTLTFEEAKADMDKLLAAVSESEKLSYRIKELESLVLRRNADMQSFVSEVGRLASEKYSDYSGLVKP